MQRFGNPVFIVIFLFHFPWTFYWFRADAILSGLMTNTDFIYLFIEMLSFSFQLRLSRLAEVSIVQGCGPWKASGEGRPSLQTHEANSWTTGVWLGMNWLIAVGEDIGLGHLSCFQLAGSQDRCAWRNASMHFSVNLQPRQIAPVPWDLFIHHWDSHRHHLLNVNLGKLWPMPSGNWAQQHSPEHLFRCLLSLREAV